MGARERETVGEAEGVDVSVVPVEERAAEHALAHQEHEVRARAEQPLDAATRGAAAMCGDHARDHVCPVVVGVAEGIFAGDGVDRLATAGSFA